MFYNKYIFFIFYSDLLLGNLACLFRSVIKRDWAHYDLTLNLYS